MKNLMINLKAKRMHMVQVMKNPISMNAGFRNTNGLKYSSMYFFSFLIKVGSQVIQLFNIYK